jgi:NAD(P)-dependent dehydrogenase (short-subunit alcohol dehydrogenase family)
MNPFTLENKTILITGASSGLGRQTAILCSQLGSNLIMLGRDHDRLEETYEELAPGNHRSLEVDITQFSMVESAIKETVCEFGKLHGLVNAAGISTTLPLKLLTPEKSSFFFDINVTSALNLSRIFASKQIVAEEGGSIILFASVMGIVGDAGKTIYGATKGALISATRSMAVELASKKIRVNSISPGVVITPMTDQAIYNQDDESRQRVIDLHPLGLGQPSDVANACVFLLSEASRWITGTNLVVDGGYTAR